MDSLPCANVSIRAFQSASVSEATVPFCSCLPGVVEEEFLRAMDSTAAEPFVEGGGGAGGLVFSDDIEEEEE